ncbi:MAG: hypothetical protein PHV06_03025 [bacterium]|nr:hypothetical protein [bacterium]
MKRFLRNYLLLTLLLIVFVFLVSCTVCTVVIKKDFEFNLQEDDPSDECLLAIEIAEMILEEEDIDLEAYKLISSQNLIIKGESFEGPEFWYLIFKRRDLIPEKEGEMIGAGGEIFVKINLAEEDGEITGYGE